MTTSQKRDTTMTRTISLNRTFVGGPLDGKSTSRCATYLAADTGLPIGRDKGFRVFAARNFYPATPAAYERLATLYAQQGETYVWGPLLRRQMLTESRTRMGLPVIEEGDYLRATLADGTEVAGPVVDVHCRNVYVRPEPKGREVKIPWSEVVDHRVDPVCGALV